MCKDHADPYSLFNRTQVSSSQEDTTGSTSDGVGMG